MVIISKSKFKITNLEDLIKQNEIEISSPVVIDGIVTNLFITTFGNIYSVINDKINYLNPVIDRSGYARIKIEIDNKYIGSPSIHRLVASAFIPNPENKEEVNHKDGDKLNNSVYNLEWVTHSENMIHAYENNLNKRGEENSQSIYTEKQIKYACELLMANKLTKNEISKITKVSVYTLDALLKHKKWRYISSNYEFNYNVKPKNTGSKPKYSDEDIHNVCRLLKDGGYTLHQISIITGVGFYTIYDIKRKRAHTDISKLYDL